MRIAIDITEAVNGFRFDVLEEGKLAYKENCATKQDALLFLLQYTNKKLKEMSKPTHTMDVI
jgi:hypothetical protein